MHKDRIQRVLIFTAHADDCEFFCGGFAAKLAKAGAEITEVIATDNCRGSYELKMKELISQSRDVEARAAARIIGKKDVHFLGFPDGYLDETPKNELRRIFMEWIRRIRPDILLSFDDYAPYEDHPDHRHVSRAALEAVSFAQNPLYHPEQIEVGLSPHLTPTRYWFAKNDERYNHIEDIGETIETKIEALCAHTSQMKMIIDDFRMIIEAVDDHKQFLPFLDRDNFPPVINLFVRAWAGQTGESEGFSAGEAFRVEHVDDLLRQIGDGVTI